MPIGFAIPRSPVARLILSWLCLLLGLLFPWGMGIRFHLGNWYSWGIFFFFGCAKLAMIVHLEPQRRQCLGGWRLAAYLTWPGLQPRPFLEKIKPKTNISLWRCAVVNLLAGTTLLWLAPWVFPTETPLEIRIALGLIGYVWLLFFGFFDLLAALYQGIGFSVEKLWDRPLLSTSLGEFWGQRWNRIFSGMARELFFLPLARHLGTKGAALVVFLFAGLSHEWAISLRTGGGYGGPVVYFLLQWLGLTFEHLQLVRNFLHSRPWLGWCWVAIMVLGPLPLLLTGSYLQEAILPELCKLEIRLE